MANIKITDLPELSETPNDANLLEIVDKASETPTSKKITWANIKAAVLTAVGKVNKAVGFTLSGGTTSKTLTVSADMTLNGYSGTTKALAGTDTASAMTPADVQAAQAVLAREPDQGVAMTYAGSGSSGIAVADNDNIDFGTGNFTLVWKGSLPDWSTSSYIRIIEKVIGDTDGYCIGIQSSKFSTWGFYGSAQFSDTVSLVNNSVHEIVAVVTRETASSDGSVSFYLDGVSILTSALGAKSPTNINNSYILNVCGAGAAKHRYASTTHHAYTFNRALTAAEVLDLYRNGISEADKWGSQTAVYTSNFSAGVDGLLTVRGTGAGNIDGIGGQDDCYRFYPTAEYNPHYPLYNHSIRYKKVKITVDVYIPSTNTNLNRVFVSVDDVWGEASNVCTTTDTWVTLTANAVTLTGSQIRLVTKKGASTNYSGAGIDTDDLLYVKNLVVTQLGATLALEPGGIQPAPGQWLDSSSNKLHAMQPATGSNLTRYKKDFEYRWTNTWTASSAAQYVGGLNQAVLSADHFITDIITQATVTTDVENLTLGDGSDADRFVAAFAPSATRTKQTIAAQNDGTNLKLVYTPAAEATMTVETIIRGFIWEP